MYQEIHKQLSEKGKKFTVELLNGITIRNSTVEYMSDNIVLFVLKNGEHRTIPPADIKKVIAE